MKLSFKQMIVSFAVSLVLFSLVMTVICVGIFNRFVKERTSGNETTVAQSLPTRKTVYNFSDAVIYYQEDWNAVMVFVCDAEKKLLLMPISESLPMNFENKIYFVSSICEKKGSDALFDIACALSGIKPDHLFSVDTSIDRINQFAEDVLGILKEDYQGYVTETISIQVDENGVADCAGTVESFFITEYH